MIKRFLATMLAGAMMLTSIPINTVLSGIQDVSVEAEDTVESTETVDQDSSEEFGAEEGVTESNEENSKTEADDVSGADEQSSEEMEGIDETTDAVDSSEAGEATEETTGSEESEEVDVTDDQDKLEEMGFKLESSMQYIKPMQETAKMLEIILGAIGGVAMLVSAINIANTMIMSIYERTREIGIMKVLGCKVGDVKKLFLFEAGLIGFIGGTIGVGLSYIVSWLMNKYGGDIFSGLMGGGMYYGEQQAQTAMSVIPIWLPFFAAGFGILVGLVSGFFPALRATRISAIEAMKNE